MSKNEPDYLVKCDCDVELYREDMVKNIATGIGVGKGSRGETLILRCPKCFKTHTIKH